MSSASKVKKLLLESFSRTTDEIFSLNEFHELIDSKKKIRIKYGVDVTSPYLHIGHAVVLRKLRHFQDIGHQSVLVIGDFTALIGDPSGRNKTRPQLTPEQVDEFAETYVHQAEHILDLKTLKIVRNGDWLGAMNFHDVIKLASHYTVARMLERDDFEKRYKSETPISIHEFLYPLAQAMDSVELNADVELGGTDQKFNLLVGRDLQKDHGQGPQVVITTPLLEGTDGIQKMSKSYDNYIGITDPPSEIFGRTMSIPDDLIVRYFEFATDVDSRVLKDVQTKLSDGKTNPRDLKRQLAREIVSLYHCDELALEAEAEFDRIFIKSDVPDKIEEWSTGAAEVTILSIMCDSGLVPSKREARRLIDQGAVTVDGEKVSNITENVNVSSPVVLKVGKRRFLRVSA